MLSSRQQLPPIRKSLVRSHLSQGKEAKRTKIGAYIDETLQNISNGCYKDGKLCLDGGYGDYRMSIFRLKDRRKRFNQIPSMFNETFSRNIDRLTPELKEQFNKIIRSKNDDYLQKKSSTIDNEQQKPKVALWNNEEEGYMFHQYVSNYEKQRWFKKVTPLPQPEQIKNESVVVESRPVRKKKPVKKDRTHFFSYLDNNSMFFVNST